jgi:UDP-4-amino-4,6-dideoxy-N-acetyl-beta-L-altrosamine N-acetyltransferase
MKIFENSGIILTNFISLTTDELKEILEWRNNELVREQMFTNEEISLEQHLSFIDSLKNSQDKLYFKVQWKDKSIGVIDYYNINRTSAFGGFYLQPSLMGSAWGIYLEYIYLEYAFEFLQINELYGEILESNESSIKVHLFFHFSTYNVTDNIIYMKITKDIWCANKEKIKPLVKILK